MTASSALAIGSARLRRLALTVPTFLALMFVTFMMIRLVPGDPIDPLASLLA